MNILNNSTREAIIAIAIQTIKSLRAMTPKSKGELYPITDTIDNDELGIAVEEASEYVVGFKTESGKRKPCIRQGNKNGAVVTESLKPWWRINISSEMYTAKVFKVTLSEGRSQAWGKYKKKSFYMVAASRDAAIYHVTNRFQKIVKTYACMGKDAWTLAMKLTTQKDSTYSSSKKAKEVLERNVKVSSNLTGLNSGNYSIEVQDNLNYAGDIIGGDSAVNLALAKALNSTNGYINRYIEKQNKDEWFDDIQATPFPHEFFDTSESKAK